MKVVDEEMPKEYNRPVALVDSEDDLWVRDDNDHVVVFIGGRGTTLEIDSDYSDRDFENKLERGDFKKLFYKGETTEIQFV